ncbi:MAG: transcriptional repressor NrdR [Deltaproteobacteria bacterium]|nr:transcriptional repressor NrdR [Deltaproteobacteria bacterium]
MNCPKCRSGETRVIDSREGADGRSVRRRRECEGCQFRFTTFERIEESLPLVVKKDGTREAFDRNKILSGLRKACEKRPVNVDQMEAVTRDIETVFIESGEKEVSSEAIGEIVIDRLQGLDQVAYIRFASVYRAFSDVSQFIDTLKSLVSTTEATAPTLPKGNRGALSDPRKASGKNTQQDLFGGGRNAAKRGK